MFANRPDLFLTSRMPRTHLKTSLALKVFGAEVLLWQILALGKIARIVDVV